jgi:hypothetical protein
MAKRLALDLAPRGIAVNNVQPGPSDPDITAGAIETLAGMSPLKRVALVAYVAGSETGYITGASITINGDFTLLPDTEGFRSAVKCEDRPDGHHIDICRVMPIALRKAASWLTRNSAPS